MRNRKGSFLRETSPVARRRSDRFYRILHQRFSFSKHKSSLPFLYRELFGEMYKRYRGYSARHYQRAFSSEQNHLRNPSPNENNDTIDVDDIDGSYENNLEYVLDNDKNPPNLSIHKSHQDRETYRRRAPRKFPSSDEESPKSSKRTPCEITPEREKNNTTEYEYVPVEDEVLFIREFRKVKTKSPSTVTPTEQHTELTEITTGSKEITETSESSNCFSCYFNHAQRNTKEEKITKKTVSDSSSSEQCNSPQRTKVKEKKLLDAQNSCIPDNNESTIEKLKSRKSSDVENDDDDIILVKNDEMSSNYVDFVMLKKVVASIFNNQAEDKKEYDLPCEFILNRLKALYHQDFSHRVPEIEYCLAKAKHRYNQNKKSYQFVRPGLRKFDIETLSPEGWLNDVIINRYMSIVVSNNKKYGSISSFCYEELLRGKEPSLPKDWMKMSAILIPICLSSHWSLMSFMPRLMSIKMYNSMPIMPMELECAHVLLDFFRTKACVGKVGNCLEVKDLPQQENEFDCGVYVCMFARCVVHGNSFNIFPQQVSEFRNWLKNEVVQGQLFGSGEVSDTIYDSESSENDESSIKCLE